MSERKAKRLESGRGAGENNGHGESRSAAGGEQPANRQLEVGAELPGRAQRAQRGAQRRDRMDLPPQAVCISQAEARPADPQARLAERREARTKRSVSRRSRGARWSFRASDSARPGFHAGRTPERIGQPMEAKVDRPKWNGPDCATQKRHSGSRARLSLRLKRGAAPFQPKLTSPDSRSETNGRSPRPRMTWSRISIRRIRPASTSWRVMRMSSAEGVASPLGWL